MIEIDTIQDIRQIESKLIGGFTFRQLVTAVIGIIFDLIIYFTTHSIPAILIVSAIVLIIGFFKKGNLTAREYIALLWDREKQPRIRTYKNNNIISEIERQCKIYKTQKKKKSKRG